MVVNRKVARGLTLVGIALFFGVQSLSFHLGTLAKAGPGLFPLMIASAVGLIGIALLVQSWFEDAEPLDFRVRSIGILLVALLGFVAIASWIGVIAATVWLVFVSSLAGEGFSLSRNLKITAVLVAVAVAFRVLLGLSLPLW